MSSSGTPGEKPKRGWPYDSSLTPEVWEEIRKFLRDPVRVRRSADAYFKLISEGKLDDVR